MNAKDEIPVIFFYDDRAVQCILFIQGEEEEEEEEEKKAPILIHSIVQKFFSL